MGGRPQKREKASGRKGWELGSTWNVKWIHVGIGFSGYVGTLALWDWFMVLRFYVGRVYGFTLGRGSDWLVERFNVKRVLRC